MLYTMLLQHTYSLYSRLSILVEGLYKLVLESQHPLLQCTEEVGCGKGKPFHLTLNGLLQRGHLLAQDLRGGREGAQCERGGKGDITLLLLDISLSILSAPASNGFSSTRTFSA